MASSTGHLRILHELIQLFAGHAEIENIKKPSEDMLRVFEEQ